jgi:hypothetical protein
MGKWLLHLVAIAIGAVMLLPMLNIHSSAGSTADGVAEWYQTEAVYRGTGGTDVVVEQKPDRLPKDVYVVIAGEHGKDIALLDKAA